MRSAFQAQDVRLAPATFSLAPEIRLIDLAAALRPLSCLQLESLTHRNAAFALAGFFDVTPDEHGIAVRRATLRIRLFGQAPCPSAPAAIASPAAALQIDRVA